MTRDELRAVVLEELAHLAPEADLAALSPTTRLREALDLDSFDFVRFITAIDERLAVQVPEVDYSKLQTLEGCMDYLCSRVPTAPTPAREPHAPSS